MSTKQQLTVMFTITDPDSFKSINDAIFASQKAAINNPSEPGWYAESISVANEFKRITLIEDALAKFSGNSDLALVIGEILNHTDLSKVTGVDEDLELVISHTKTTVE